MKPFYLEKALAGEPVITRDGRKVTEIYHFKTRKSEYSVNACIDGYIREYTTEGRYYNMGDASEHDLVMYEPVVEGWVNVYHHAITGNMWVGDVHFSYEHAIDISKNSEHYIKTIKITNQPE